MVIFGGSRVYEVEKDGPFSWVTSFDCHAHDPIGDVKAGNARRTTLRGYGVAACGWATCSGGGACEGRVAGLDDASHASLFLCTAPPLGSVHLVALESGWFRLRTRTIIIF
jgi:hypothetical protein